MLGQRCMMQWL